MSTILSQLGGGWATCVVDDKSRVELVDSHAECDGRNYDLRKEGERVEQAGESREGRAGEKAGRREKSEGKQEKGTWIFPLLQSSYTSTRPLVPA
eukprot:763840-Hanusia_phi.AAC.4